jgi:hypothetical protein
MIYDRFVSAYLRVTSNSKGSGFRRALRSSPATITRRRRDREER